jgi:steroid 5-alpha reductase family enzyme
MTDFLTWLGWSVDNTFVPVHVAATFWQSPLGLFCTGSLLITSAFRVMHDKARAGIFDTLWHCAFATVTGAGFVIGLSGSLPHQLIKSLVILTALRGIYKAVEVLRKE